MTSAPWWQSGVVYQIYPRSFQDSNGDGIGDLPGISQRIDYLADLGIDAIWLSPVYPSPMADFGYDVANYVDIDAVFGTLADLDALVKTAHQRGLKVIMDLVPNHTSDQHPWFLESRASRDNPKRDWYVWRDPKPDGSVPTNWLSEFGGPSWTLDPITGQYYYHAYLAAQPDLNWRNREVVAAMDDVLRFWFDRGVDGFRLDTIHHLIEDADFRDNPPNPDFKPGDPPTKALQRLYTNDRPETQTVLARFRQIADEYDDRALIGEAYIPLEALMAYYGHAGSGLHLPFNFQLLSTPWTPQDIAELIQRYEALLPPGAWPNWVLGNHDRQRLISRIGETQAPLAAMLLLSLRGTPTIYYGEEIGMSDVPIPPELVQDPWEKQVPGHGLGRDPARTPMAWSPERKSGFTHGIPWLPLGDDALARNVATQKADPQSLWSLYRDLLHLRRTEPALAVGDCVAIQAERSVLRYERHHAGRRFSVILNFGDEVTDVSAPGGDMIYSTASRNGRRTVTDRVRLLAHEGVLVAHAR